MLNWGCILSKIFHQQLIGGPSKHHHQNRIKPVGNPCADWWFLNHPAEKTIPYYKNKSLTQQNSAAPWTNFATTSFVTTWDVPTPPVTSMGSPPGFPNGSHIHMCPTNEPIILMAGSLAQLEDFLLSFWGKRPIFRGELLNFQGVSDKG